jgi:septal ring factor EnvC (AmiA/AmiB activator)
MKRVLLVFFFFCATPIYAANLSDQLNRVRSDRLNIEKSLMDAKADEMATRVQLKRLNDLKRLQSQEKLLTEKRMAELTAYLRVLTQRRSDVQKRIRDEQYSLREKLSALIHPLLYRQDQWIRGDQGEGSAQLKRHVFSQVVLTQLKDLESMYADLQDASEIESRITHEQDQMNALLQDLLEQENVIQFHQKLRESKSEEMREERMRQLEQYRNLRNSEIDIERMIEQFQARQEHVREKDLSRQTIVPLKPKTLPWPVAGTVVQSFGVRKDEITGLQVFNKGIQIRLSEKSDLQVRSVAEGLVQYAGEIPGKGNVLILEHPRDLYTIYSGLATFTKKVGDQVPLQATLGDAQAGQSIYFEIRSRNLAIDPLKWLQ